MAHFRINRPPKMALLASRAYPSFVIQSRYKPGHDFTLLQACLESVAEQEREEVLAGIEEWLINKFAHEKGNRPYLFVARDTDDFFIIWTDFDPNRAPPSKTA